MDSHYGGSRVLSYLGFQSKTTQQPHSLSKLLHLQGDFDGPQTCPATPFSNACQSIKRASFHRYLFPVLVPSFRPAAAWRSCGVPTLAAFMQVIFCIGELLEERESGKTDEAATELVSVRWDDPVAWGQPVGSSHTVP